MKIAKAIFCQEAFGAQELWVGSKKFVQQVHSQFCARSVLALREHGKLARTPLAAFFNRPIREDSLPNGQWFNGANSLLVMVLP